MPDLVLILIGFALGVFVTILATVLWAACAAAGRADRESRTSW